MELEEFDMPGVPRGSSRRSSISVVLGVGEHDIMINLI
jgi:hypothetical protein